MAVLAKKKHTLRGNIEEIYWLDYKHNFVSIAKVYCGWYKDKLFFLNQNNMFRLCMFVYNTPIGLL